MKKVCLSDVWVGFLLVWWWCFCLGLGVGVCEYVVCYCEYVLVSVE